MMRSLVYYIATTLDGFIARSDGSFDDFPWDDEFGAHLFETFPETWPAHLRPDDPTREGNRRFDAVLMGRRTYEVGLVEGITSPYPTLDQHVFSTTMDTSLDPAVTLVQDDPVSFVAELKDRPGRDIWICGGSVLATPLFEAGLVDELILKLNPVAFGEGIPLFGSSVASRVLRPKTRKLFPSGHAWLEFEVEAAG